MATFMSTEFFAERTVEPVKRMCGGSGPRWVSHRFPIKGGLPRRVLWEFSMLEAVSKETFFARWVRVQAGLKAAGREHESPITFVADL